MDCGEQRGSLVGIGGMATVEPQSGEGGCWMTSMDGGRAYDICLSSPLPVLLNFLNLHAKEQDVFSPWITEPHPFPTQEQHLKMSQSIISPAGQVQVSRKERTMTRKFRS